MSPSTTQALRRGSSHVVQAILEVEVQVMDEDDQENVIGVVIWINGGHIKHIPYPAVSQRCVIRGELIQYQCPF